MRRFIGRFSYPAAFWRLDGRSSSVGSGRNIWTFFRRSLFASAQPLCIAGVPKRTRRRCRASRFGRRRDFARRRERRFGRRFYPVRAEDVRRRAWNRFAGRGDSFRLASERDVPASRRAAADVPGRRAKATGIAALAVPFATVSSCVKPDYCSICGWAFFTSASARRPCSRWERPATKSGLAFVGCENFAAAIRGSTAGGAAARKKRVEIFSVFIEKFLAMRTRRRYNNGNVDAALGLGTTSRLNVSRDI